MKKNSRSVSIGRNLEIAKKYKEENAAKEAELAVQKKEEAIQSEQKRSSVTDFLNQMRKTQDDTRRFKELNAKLYKEAHPFGDEKRVVPRASYEESTKTIERTGYSGVDMDTSSESSRMRARNKR